jgi:hypothetical protein
MIAKLNMKYILIVIVVKINFVFFLFSYNYTLYLFGPSTVFVVLSQPYIEYIYID